MKSTRFVLPSVVVLLALSSQAQAFRDQAQEKVIEKASWSKRKANVQPTDGARAGTPAEPVRSGHP
ncbi:hypothetical protein [Ralstonia soli]|uniref:Uncharacterized protein n=1 Tax=Ralstonia soli TaxID=2953896 RepID=A0ABT1AHA1_9RALS|nr:hypothetical protein [Ralstonia soli]MCO5397792.1 hypothetical protein [Ralstonia soli]